MILHRLSRVRLIVFIVDSVVVVELALCPCLRNTFWKCLGLTRDGAQEVLIIIIIIIIIITIIITITIIIIIIPRRRNVSAQVAEELKKTVTYATPPMEERRKI